MMFVIHRFRIQIISVDVNENMKQIQNEHQIHLQPEPAEVLFSKPGSVQQLWV